MKKLVQMWRPTGARYLSLAVLGAGLGSWWVVSDDRSPVERTLIGVPINVAALLTREAGQRRSEGSGLALSRATRRAHVATFAGAVGVSMVVTVCLRRAAWRHKNDWPPP